VEESAVSVQLLPDRPLEPSVPSSWEVMEARLATAKAQALLERVSHDLQRLLAGVALDPDIAAGTSDTLAAVARAQESLAATRGALRT
jgi:hypothetical protein